MIKFKAIAAGILILSPGVVSSPLVAEEFIVKTQNLEDRKAVFATVETVDRILARARIGGTLGGLNIDEGSQVVAGQKIAVISDQKLPLKLAALNAKLRSSMARQKLAQTDLKRTQSLRKTGAASQSRLDISRTKLDIVKSEIATLNAERLIVIRQIKEGEVLAPVAGRVLAVAFSNGSVVLPGETLAVIAKDSYILRLRLPERHARFLTVGDQVQVSQRGGLRAEGATSAVVQQVYPAMEQGRVIADIKVSGLGNYFVGERTRVHIATGTRPVIAAPKRFFFQRYGISFAKLKNSGEVTVRLGLALKGAADGAIEVLSGLKTGDILVTP